MVGAFTATGLSLIQGLSMEEWKTHFFFFWKEKIDFEFILVFVIPI